MRIAVYHNLLFGGAKQAMYEYVKRLAGDFEVDVYQGCAGGEDQELSKHAAHVYTIGYVPTLARRFSNPYIYTPVLAWDIRRIFSSARRAASEMNKVDYAWVFVHHDRYIQNPPVTKFLKHPTVMYCQEPFRLFYEPAWDVERTPKPSVKYGLLAMGVFHALLKRVSTIGIKHSDILLVNSHYSRESVYKAYSRWAHVSYLGVDVAKYSCRHAHRENIVLSVGIIGWKKKHDLVIKSLAQIEEGIRPKLVIISPTTSNRGERDFLVKLARSLRVECEILVGIGIEEVVALYNRTFAVVCCSVMEPFGLVPLEAMACGTPVIAVNEGGYRETVLNGLTGYLTERDPAEIAEKLTYLLSDPEAYRGMSQRCVEHVGTEWTWERRYKEFRALVDKLLAGGTRRP